MALSDHTRRLSDFIADLGWKNLPPEAILKRNTTNLLDTPGMALAGAAREKDE